MPTEIKRLKFISAIIRTYNRCESLKNTLDSLLTQEYDGSFDWEVVVGDNNSKDRAKEVFGFYEPKFNGRLRYVFEPNQGLSYARNRGIKESKGEKLCLGEGFEFIYRLKKSGEKAMYYPKAVFLPNIVPCKINKGCICTD